MNIPRTKPIKRVARTRKINELLPKDGWQPGIQSAEHAQLVGEFKR
jgi:hypothetical protein